MSAAGALLLACIITWLQADTGKEAPAKHEFQGPESCAPCHPRHYQEWRGSAHAYSAVDPIVQACNRKALRDTDGAVGGLCVGCHAPVSVRSGELQGSFEMNGLSPAGQRGISCEICHRMEPPKPGAPIANASFELAEGNIVHGRLLNPTASPAHVAIHSEFIGKSIFCGTCHDVLHNSALLEKSFAQWSGSVHEERADQCQNCHMLRYSGQAAVGGPFRETLHRHNFPAVTIPIVPFPNKGYQREQIQEFLKTAARMDVRAPSEAAAGSELAFTVSVKNSGAGHNLPTGLSNERQMWIEATVLDPEGRVLYQSGGLDANGDLMDHHSALRPGADPALALFTDRFRNAKGEEVPFIWLASRVEERSLKPLEERGSTYRAPIPASLLGKHVRLRVRLLFRPFPPYAMRDLGLGDHVKDLPIWVMDDWTSDSIPVVKEVVRQTVWRVPQDFPSIVAAWKELRDGDRLLVGPGEHVLERPLDFGGRRIIVQSTEGPARTVLRLAKVPEAKEASVVVFRSGEGPETRLEGFLLKEGRGMLIDGSRRGGGVFINRSSPTIADVQILSCEAKDGFGGGVYCEEASPELTKLEIHYARARQGGGLLVRGAASRPRLAGVRIHGSQAELGGGVFVGRGVELHMERCELAGNQATSAGGGLYAEDASVWTAEHSTFVFNRASAAPGAIRSLPGARGSLTHSIFFSNEPPGADGTVTRSLVDFEAVPPDCRKGFPLFMDPSGSWHHSTRQWIAGDYRLLWGSPAIDAGDPLAPPDPDDSLPDLGAHFFEQRPRAFIRGDVNGDGSVQWSDVLALFEALVRARKEKDQTGGATSAIPCLDAADLSDDGRILPGDLAWLAAYAILGGPPPAFPWPQCGVDPTPGEGLSCVRKGAGCRED